MRGRSLGNLLSNNRFAGRNIRFAGNKTSSPFRKMPWMAGNGLAVLQIFPDIASLYLKRLPSRARNGGHTRYASNPRRKNQKNFCQRQVFCRCLWHEAMEEVFLLKKLLRQSETPGCRFIHTQKGKRALRKNGFLFFPPANNNPLTFSTSILIPKSKIETQEISYTEDDRYVSINISATKEEISKENVIFKTLPAKVDAVFYFPPFGKPTKRKTAGGVVQK